ncbi:MAG TPA: hypothetical protein ENH82_10155 [bacterium]|nr:hypothetical protein [bacterium]
MQATIRIDDKGTFQSLMNFLKSLNIEVEEEKKPRKRTNSRYHLRGSVLEYKSPYEPATDIKNWEALK